MQTMTPDQFVRNRVTNANDYVTIRQDEQVSNILDTKGGTVVAIATGNTLTPANLVFKVYNAIGQSKDVYDPTSPADLFAILANPSGYYYVGGVFAGATKIQVISQLSQPVECTIELIMAPLWV